MRSAARCLEAGVRRYIGENHFAPFPEEPYGRGWYKRGGVDTFGPLPRPETSEKPKRRTPRRLEDEAASPGSVQSRRAQKKLMGPVDGRAE